MSGELYRRVQFGWAVLLALASGVLVLALVLPLGAPRGVVWLPIGILALTFPLTGWMTVTVTPAHLRFTMGIGLIHRNVPIALIALAEAVETPWYYGVGIHLTREGPIFNVSGRGAIHLVLKDGKRLLVGSADADGAVAAINQAKVHSAPHVLASPPAES